MPSWIPRISGSPAATAVAATVTNAAVLKLMNFSAIFMFFILFRGETHGYAPAQWGGQRCSVQEIEGNMKCQPCAVVRVLWRSLLKSSEAAYGQLLTI